METKRHPVNLKQYRKVNGKWQFVPGGRDASGSRSATCCHQWEPTSSKGGPSTSNSNRMENGGRSLRAA
jgi:hypothetical protein